jgi:hypothetical protein
MGYTNEDLTNALSQLRQRELNAARGAAALKHAEGTGTPAAVASTPAARGAVEVARQTQRDTLSKPVASNGDAHLHVGPTCHIEFSCHLTQLVHPGKLFNLCGRGHDKIHAHRLTQIEEL